MKMYVGLCEGGSVSSGVVRWGDVGRWGVVEVGGGWDVR
jgi:hypothetical protein